MWVYWDINNQLTQDVINNHNAIAETDMRYGTTIGYCLINNRLYSVSEPSICHFPKVTTLKEIDEIRLMYSLGLTEKDM